jgi:hypothetical protein
MLVEYSIVSIISPTNSSVSTSSSSCSIAISWERVEDLNVVPEEGEIHAFEDKILQFFALFVRWIECNVRNQFCIVELLLQSVMETTSFWLGVQWSVGLNVMCVISFVS